MKQCSICKKEKEINLVKFKPNKISKDGLTSYCRDCKQKIDRVYSRKYRQKNPEWKKKDNKRMIKNGVIQKSVEMWRKKNPEKYKAYKIFAEALRKKILKKEPCIVCDEIKVDGHHSDYSKPLDVIWICHNHHKKFHAGLITI